jgi:hypothetical protein
MFRVRSEKTRLELADAILRPICESHGLKSEFETAYSAADYCRKIRNQYAHCHWLGDKEKGLFFSNIEPSAAKKTGDVIMRFSHIDEPLLQKQEAYFAETQIRLWWIAEGLKMKAAGQSIPKFSIGKPARQPPRHNPPEQHSLPKRLKDPLPSGKGADTEPAE